MMDLFTVRGVNPAIKQAFKLTCLKKRETAGQAVSELLLNYIALAGFEDGLWEGYKKAPWNTLKNGDTVWIAGADRGLPWAYGPHTVVDAPKRVLRNAKGITFTHYQELLLKSV